MAVEGSFSIASLGEHSAKGRNKPRGNRARVDALKAPVAGRVLLSVEVGNGAHQLFPRSQRSAMGDLGKQKGIVRDRSTRN